MPTAILGSHRASGRSITEQFHAFDAHNPRVYRALERLAAGATRVSLKDLFETCAVSFRTASPG